MRLDYQIKEWFQEAKWVWQRAFRGYDDPTCWDLRSAIAEIAVPALTYMIEKGHGYPMGETDESWKEKLKIMRTGFQAMLASYPYPDGFFDKWPAGKEVPEDWESWHKQKYEQTEAGMEVFAKSYQGLWD